MKYSFLMPFYNRADSFIITLSSFKDLYRDRNDYEVIIIEEYKNIVNVDYHEKLKNAVAAFSPFISIKHIEYNAQPLFNPSILYNFGSKFASGSHLIITNPECCHMVDILKGFDEEFVRNAKIYVACSCLAVRSKSTIFATDKVIPENFTIIQWYNHTKHRNCNWHFCTCISKESYCNFGGFDEEFSKGIDFEDADFINTVRKSGLLVVPRDDLLTYHIEHDKSFLNQPNSGALKELNRIYYHTKWK